MLIRNYQSSDFETVSRWWAHSKEIGPLEGMLPPESTYILELDGIPALCVTIILTNTKEFCYLENFAGNPTVERAQRRKASQLLTKHVTTVAKSLGYKRLLCLAYKGPLKKRYQELGFTRTLDGVSGFCKSTLE